MTPNGIAVVAALPWGIVALITAARLRNSSSLDEESAEPPIDPPLVSVVIPARNEALNIERCVRSVLASTYPRLEVMVVDDHSSDGTAEIAARIGIEDERLHVMLNALLPEGWFGKQWACHNGATASKGSIILFADADTVQASDLVARSINMMLRRGADLFSVAGKQVMGSFWEKLVQPQVFGILAVRFGGTDSVTDSRLASSKIANGQCLFVKRSTYDELGGHELVKSHVADDLMMAQRYFARGKKVVLAEGLSQLSTRMYKSLGELVHGWGKNVFAGGIDSVPGGWIGKLFYPFMLLSAPLSSVLPALVLIAGAFFPVATPFIVWASLTQLELLAWWTVVYWRSDESPFYALLTPIGAAVVFYIFSRAILRGRRVVWKGREYVSS